MDMCCTIATRNYLPFALALARSVRLHNPQLALYVLVVDAAITETDRDTFEDVTLLGCADIGIDRVEFRRRGAMFGPRGLSCSLKAPLMKHLVQEPGSVVLFLDADGLVFGDLSPIFDLARCEGLVLSPHLHDPIDRRTAGYELEETFLKFGVFNTGLLAATNEASAFIEWWTERTSRRCIEAPEMGYIVDQNWASLAPALFHVAVLRHRGTNVMWWNLYDRDVEWTAGTPSISGVPLIHFHFAGFDFGDQVTLGAANNAWRANFPGFDEKPGALRVCEIYANRLKAAGLLNPGRDLPSFVRLPDGSLFSDEQRTVYRELVEWAEINGLEEPTNPFDE